MSRRERQHLSVLAGIALVLLLVTVGVAFSGLGTDDNGDGDDNQGASGTTVTAPGTTTDTGTGTETTPGDGTTPTDPGQGGAPTVDPAQTPGATSTGEQGQGQGQVQPGTTPSTTQPGQPTTTTGQPTSPTTSEPGAILPNYRVISYYGHPNSTDMGILGEFSKEEVLQKLRTQAAAYEAADPAHPVKVAFELIATVAQNWEADNGTYTSYTGDEIIQEYVDFTAANDVLLILDLQIGWDSIPNQIEKIRKWLAYPHVHLALDPEFSMKANEIVPRDRIPGEFIGEVNGHDVQVGVELISQMVQEQGLPPKMLILHQFEEEMIYNKSAITPLNGVQIVLDMDGFGSPEAKTVNYGHFVTEELIQYGGIKLFYRQDDPLLTEAQIVELDPPALVVIYQ